MSDLLKKINLYGQFAYLFVGVLALFVIYLDLYLINYDLASFPTLGSLTDTANILPFTLIAYFIGNILQSLSSVGPFKKILNIEKIKNDFSDEQKQDLEKAKLYFRVKYHKDQNNENDYYNKLWNLCYTYAQSKDDTGQVLNFSAQHGLYKGLYVLFFLESLFFGVLLTQNSTALIGLVISIIFSYALCLRARKFLRYMTSKTIESYIVKQADNQTA